MIYSGNSAVNPPRRIHLRRIKSRGARLERGRRGGAAAGEGRRGSGVLPPALVVPPLFLAPLVVVFVPVVVVLVPLVVIVVEVVLVVPPLLAVGVPRLFLVFLEASDERFLEAELLTGRRVSDHVRHAEVSSGRTDVGGPGASGRDGYRPVPRSAGK